MPIQPSLNLESVSDAQFEIIDDAVMRCAYASQNKFGRKFDERVYENDIAARLRAEGFEVHTQVPVKVVHGDFEKVYYLDLVVNQMLYELKVVVALSPEHDAQALHYAMLQNIHRVKLINFGEKQVRGSLLRNALTTPERYFPTQRKSGWKAITPHCERLLDYTKELIKDWGTHLECSLYEEALVHHFGGDAHCLQRLNVRAGALTLGTHVVQLYAPAHAFVVTAFTGAAADYKRHLEILLAHVELDGIQWINLNRSRLEVTTLQRNGRGMEAEE